jgi:hypothetical protein
MTKETINEVLEAERKVFTAIDDAKMLIGSFTREELIDLIYRAMEEKESFKL